MSAVRLFGKLPAHGDFVARGVTGAEQAMLDDWLSASMADARQALGKAFDARFDHAPPWRYVDESGKAGALAASQDASGRRFPVLLGIDGPPDAAEALLYAAIGEGWTADQLVAEAAALVPEPDEQAVAPGWWTLGGEGFAPADLPGERPPGLIAAMLAGEGA